MENQNQSSSKTQPQKQQSKSSSPSITQNRTRKENTQNTSSPDSSESATKTENIQPKFQSKHKNRNVNPPQTKEAAKRAETEESGPAVQKPGTATMPQSQSKQQTGESNPSSAENETQSNDAGSQSSKLGAQTEQSSEEATNNNGSGTVVPPQSHFSSSGDDSTSPKPANGKKKWLIVAIVVVLLVLGVGGYAVYAHYVAPRQAPVSYMQKLADMQSGEYQIEVATVDGDSPSGTESDGDEQARRPGVVPDGNVELTQEQQQGAQLPGGVPDPEINVRAEGEFSNDQNNPENSQFSSTVDVEYDQSFLNIDQSFDFRFRDNTGYVRFENTDLLSFFLPGIQANEWYSWEVDNEEAAREIFPVKCTEEDREALTGYFENEATDRVEIANPQRNDWFGMKRNDVRVRHYSGEITGTSLVNLLQGAADATSEECIASDDINETELNELNFVYDLYTGNDQDEMVVRVFKDDEEQAKVALTTSGYNQEVNISTPENSTPIQELMGNGVGQNGNFRFNFNNGGSTSESSMPSGDSLFESSLQ